MSLVWLLATHGIYFQFPLHDIIEYMCTIRCNFVSYIPYDAMLYMSVSYAVQTRQKIHSVS